ncbi:MAG: outer membrane beta-barrel protein [Bacteroidota bacterium]
MKSKAHFFGLLLLFFATSSLIAQSSDEKEEDAPSLVDKGSLLFGGSIALTSQGGDLFGNNNNRFNAFSFSPNALYFVADRFAVGGQLGYTVSWVDGTSSNTIDLGPRAGYYYDLGNGFIPFGAVGLSYNYAWVADGDLDADGWGFSVGAGAIYTIGNLGISAELAYNWEQQDVSFFDDFEEIVNGNGIGLNIGLVGFLNNRESRATSEEKEIVSPIRKGNILIGGSFSLESLGGELNELNEERVNSFSILPGALFFVTDNIAVGPQLAYTINWTGGDENSTHGLAIGPSAGYFYDLGNGIIPFGVLGITYSRVWVSNTDVSRNLLGLEVGAGTLLTVSENLALSAQVNYNWTTTAEADPVSGDIIGVRVGIVGFITR